MIKDTDSIHIGKMIQAELKRQGRTVVWFANAIHRDYSDVHKMFKRESIDIAMLIRISHVLSYDFFSDISEWVKATQT